MQLVLPSGFMRPLACQEASEAVCTLSCICMHTKSDIQHVGIQKSWSLSTDKTLVLNPNQAKLAQDHKITIASVRMIVCVQGTIDWRLALLMN